MILGSGKLGATPFQPRPQDSAGDIMDFLDSVRIGEGMV